MPQPPSRILSTMRSVNPSSPRLVWHGQDGRIELSGRVFDNWVAKSSNLLVDELDATDTSRIALDLPPHWKSLALAFACWQVGALVILPEETASPPDADILLSSRPDPEAAPSGLLVCVALGSLALGWDGPLPRGAVDFAAEVRSHGDVYQGQSVDDDAPLLQAGVRTLTAQDLLDTVTLPAAPGDTDTDGPTLLLEPGAGLERTLAAALAVWAQGGVLVLVEDGLPVTDRLLTGERVTGRLGTA